MMMILDEDADAVDYVAAVYGHTVDNHAAVDGITVYDDAVDDDNVAVDDYVVESVDYSKYCCFCLWLYYRE